MKIQITIESVDSKYLNAFVEDGIVKTEKNGIIILQKRSYSGSSKLENQETIVSISQESDPIGIIYSS
jgi:hypothetical protein